MDADSFPTPRFQPQAHPSIAEAPPLPLCPRAAESRVLACCWSLRALQVLEEHVCVGVVRATHLQSRPEILGLLPLWFPCALVWAQMLLGEGRRSAGTQR